MNTQMKLHTAESNNLQAQIDAENQRDESASRAKREELTRKITEFEAKVTTSREEMKTTKAKLSERREAMEALKTRGQGVSSQIAQLEAQETQTLNALKAIAESEKDSLAPFGRNMRNVLETIKRERWHGDMPLGPYGLYVKLNDAEYGDVLRHRLGRTLTSFAVTDARDRKPLQDILKKNQKSVYFPCFSCRVLI